MCMLGNFDWSNTFLGRVARIIHLGLDRELLMYKLTTYNGTVGSAVTFSTLEELLEFAMRAYLKETPSNRYQLQRMASIAGNEVCGNGYNFDWSLKRDTKETK